MTAVGKGSPNVTADAQAHLRDITPEMDRRNGRIFAAAYTLKYLIAPVGYVGVVQAALCDKLGASPTIANLPAAAYLFGHFVPLAFASMVPHRRVRTVVVGAYTVTALMLGTVCALLVAPVSTEARIAAVIAQGLVQGASSSLGNVYVWQCIGRGTTLEGRARTLKLTYTLGPVAAVAGSLGAQLALSGRIPALGYPYDFAAIYLAGFLSVAVAALLSRRYELVEIPEEPRPGLLASLDESVRDYARDRSLVVLWLAYFCWYACLNGISNLSLYTRQATGREPKELSGIIMALRFGCKSLAGFGLGVLAERRGSRAPLEATVVLLGVGMAWAWLVPGWGYLLAFGLLGAGELGGAYFPNHMVAISPPATGARNLAILTLTSTASSVAPPLYGALTQTFGFRTAFALGLGFAATALFLARRLPRAPESGC